VTAGTIAEYRRLASRTWLPLLGPLPVDAINRDMVARWVNTQERTLTQRERPTSSKTIRNAHDLLSSVMSSAIESGHRTDNPCRGLRLPRSHKDEMVFLSQSEFPLPRSAEQLVFVGPNGGTVHHEAFHPHVWLPAVEAAYPTIGKHPRIHDQRHTHASWLFAAGVPLPMATLVHVR
jgi:hypothetical protein